MKRRTFLKYCGITALAATIPLEVLEAARKDVGIIPLEELEAYLAKYPAIISVNPLCHDGRYIYPTKTDLIQVRGEVYNSDSVEYSSFFVFAPSGNKNQSNQISAVTHTSFLSKTYGTNWECYAL